MSRSAALALAALALLAAAPARAQQRPSEDEMFGGAKGEGRPAPETSPRPEESQLFGAPPAAQAAPSPPEGIIPREREDTTRIGGLLYPRAETAAVEGQEPGDFALSSPNLLDVYLDARPNDRVRAFVLGRMFYDPTFRAASLAAPAIARSSTRALASCAATPSRAGSSISSGSTSTCSARPS
jgi:hypothetical protein